MIIDTPDPSQVILEALARNQDGTAKTDVSSGVVRVYHMVGAVETEVLSSVALLQVGASSTWRYRWTPTSLASGNYVVEYELTDSDGLVGISVEDLVVEDFAQQSTLLLMQADLTLVRKIETGRWKIVGDQMIFYDDDEATPLITFDLKDSIGQPTMADVFERIEAP